ncbi:MAG: sulfatase-like hydrolase/transferase [Candidatus Cyclobacteriaceae bacterium M3_2C_046]
MKKFILITFICQLGWIFSCGPSREQTSLEKPNILWVTAEDITTMLGCYGDKNASTPHLDQFAQTSEKYTNAFATAPVCSPSRSCIITGRYANTLGSQHLRSEVEIPDQIKTYPKYLREAGYFTTNNDKEDYNFIDTTIWDLSSKKAHWKFRQPDQPFFSIFNLGLTHQSSIFGSDSIYRARIREFLPYIQVASPDSLELPPYYPDTPEVRKLWGRYYTNVSIIDYQFNQILQELEKEGLSENTIVFFYSDHGTGMPRAKRAVYDSGLKIPLLVHIPQKYQDFFNFQPGTANDRLVSFIDFAPTVLALAGQEVPDAWPGQTFISNEPLPPADYVFGAADRVDEGYEVARTIRTAKYRYVRNFLPYLALLQPNFYTDQSAIMKELSRFRQLETLNEAQQTMFAALRRPEELYDLERDPYEVNNLAEDPAYQEILQDLRSKLKQEILKIHDTGFMPEPEMVRLSQESTPYDVAHDQEIFPLTEILAASDLMLAPSPAPDKVIKYLQHPNGFVRYWAVVAVQHHKMKEEQVVAQLNKLLADDFATVQVESAKTLVKLGQLSAVQTIVNNMQAEDKVLVLFATRAFQEVHQLLPDISQEVYQVYEKIGEETNQGQLWHKYYQLYTYWSLIEIMNEVSRI